MAENDSPKIQIDTDWKAEAQKEKQRLTEQSTKADAPQKGASGGEKTSGGGASGSGGRMPEANFQTLLSTMVTQALFAMGAIPDPHTGQRMAHMELARHHIDMLSVLEEKTKGNLSKEESDTLTTTLYELRSQYVQSAQTARNAALAQGGRGGPDVAG